MKVDGQCHVFILTRFGPFWDQFEVLGESGILQLPDFAQLGMGFVFLIRSLGMKSFPPLSDRMA